MTPKAAHTSEYIRYRTCPLCESTCGLAITYRDGRAVSVTGDKKDVFSRGYLCPKGAALVRLHDDPDRLRRPLIRNGSAFQEATWAEAFKHVEDHLMPIIGQHGRDAVGVYLGNPCSHTPAATLCLPTALKALKSKNIFTASTVDQMPKHVACGLMYGGPLTIPVPDIDRTAHLLIIGANPMVSNGSLATAPDFPGRLRALKKRGGKLVVIDPRRTRTAKMADTHIAIKPGADIFLLLAMANVLFGENRLHPGHLEAHINGLETLRDAITGFTPERVQDACGVPANVIRRLALDLAAASSAAVYGRMGVSTVRFGAAANWMVDVLNIMTGNLDRPGGAMFPLPAHLPKKTKPGGKGWKMGRWQSRVKGVPEIRGELPVHTMCDEIETSGQGQIRALLTVAGNPVIALPNASRVDRALAGLEYMVSVDFYVNASTRHANVILPPTGPLTTAHYDVAFYNLAVRNISHYSPPDHPKPEDEMDKWEIIYKLGAIFSGFGADTDIATIDDFILDTLLAGAARKTGVALPGDTSEIRRQLKQYRGPDRILDFLLRTGAYGDLFGEKPDGLNLERLKTHVHGLDLGPLEPQIPGILDTPSGKIDVAPQQLMSDLERIKTALESKAPETLHLIGRRHLRTNNSWMANIPSLVTGPPRCTLQMHPEDARRLGLTDGDSARISTASASLSAPVEITADLRPGVVCFPHGWGHDLEGVTMRTARKHGGINKNKLTDDTDFDPVSGTSVLNGVPVQVRKA